MQKYEKIFISIGRKNIMKTFKSYQFGIEKLKLFGNNRVYSVDAQKVNTYEKYDEKMAKLEFEVNHIRARFILPYIKANYNSKIRFLQDLHPHFRIQRLYKYDKHKNQP